MSLSLYDKEFKEEAVKMSYDIGAVKTSEDLGINISTLYTWISKAKHHGNQAHVGSGRKRQNPANEESVKMQKRIRELEKANQILKDALGFFALSQKK